MPRNISPFLGYTVKLICRDCGQDFIGGDGMVRCKACAKLTKNDKQRITRLIHSREKERYSAKRKVQRG
jgi:hypothetical protein